MSNRCALEASLDRVNILPFGKWIELGNFDCSNPSKISCISSLQCSLDTELTLTVGSERPKSRVLLPVSKI